MPSSPTPLVACMGNILALCGFQLGFGLRGEGLRAAVPRRRRLGQCHAGHLLEARALLPRHCMAAWPVLRVHG